MDAEKELYGISRASEIMGMQFFALDNLTIQNVNKKPSRLRLFYMFFALIVNISLLVCIVAVWTENKAQLQGSEVENENKISALITFLGAIMTFTVLFLIHVTPYKFTRKMKEFFINSREISLLLLELDGVLDYRKVKIAWIYLSMFSLGVVARCACMVYELPSGYKSATASAHLQIVEAFYIFKFVVSVAIINQQLTKLHLILKELFVPKHEKNFCFKVVGSNLIEPKKLLFRKIKIARTIYTRVQENAKILNDFSGAVILSYYVLMILVVIFGGYRTVLFVKGILPLRIELIMVVILRFSSLALPTIYCQATLNLVRNFLLLHDSLTEYFRVKIFLYQY